MIQPLLRAGQEQSLLTRASSVLPPRGRTQTIRCQGPSDRRGGRPAARVSAEAELEGPTRSRPGGIDLTSGVRVTGGRARREAVAGPGFRVRPSEPRVTVTTVSPACDSEPLPRCHDPSHPGHSGGHPVPGGRQEARTRRTRRRPAVVTRNARRDSEIRVGSASRLGSHGASPGKVGRHPSLDAAAIRVWTHCVQR
jgi:hypothetical protein